MTSTMLKAVSIFAAGVFVGLATAGYGREVLQDRERKGHEILAEFLKAGKLGSSRDYWLQKSGSLSTSYVALFFGYYDDLEGCQEAVDALKVKNYNAGYRCVPAN